MTAKTTSRDRGFERSVEQADAPLEISRAQRHQAAGQPEVADFINHRQQCGGRRERDRPEPRRGTGLGASSNRELLTQMAQDNRTLRICTAP